MLRKHINHFNGFIDRFVPARLWPDAEIHRRSRGLVIISFAIAPWWPWFARLYYKLGATNVALLIFIVGALIVSVPFVLRITGSLVASTNALAAFVFATLTAIAASDGGLYAQSLLNLPLVPMLVISLANVASGLWWTVICVLQLTAFFLLEKKGYHIPRVSPADEVPLLWLNALIASVTVTALIIAYYEKTRNKLYQIGLQRAKELENRNQIILDQQKKIVMSSKMAALGEMAGGVAHEINNPLAAIQNLSSQIEEIIAEEPLDKKLVIDLASKLMKTSDRIAKIVLGLRAFSRDGSNDPHSAVRFGDLIEETFSFCREKFKSLGIRLIMEPFPQDLAFEGRKIEISQVLLNLLNNAADAVAAAGEKWVKVSAADQQESVEIRITDSGGAIPPEVRDKIFQPFFTTKDIGKGTGLGLSISLGIIQAHHGTLNLDPQSPKSPNTCFVIRLPKKQLVANKAA